MQSRALPIAALILTIATGLVVRAAIPGWWGKHLGVALWAVAAFWMVRAAFPSWSLRSATALALAISWGIEVAQLAGLPRTFSSFHPLLRLIFGETFHGADLVALAIGVAGAAGAAQGLTLLGRTPRAP